MKVLLTTPPRPRQADVPIALVPPMMPLGIGFLASVLEGKGHSVKIVDNFLYGSKYAFERFLFKENFLRKLRGFDPDLVGIYTDTISFQKTLELIKIIKRNSRARIVCGGPHASLMPESLPAEVDFVVRGEGEFALLDIAEGRTSQRIVSCSRLDNLDDLPMPAWHLYEIKGYALKDDMYLPDPPVFNLNTSRGCPFGCKFCSVPGVWGSRYRMFSARRIVDEIGVLIERYGIKGIYFREDNFTVSKERVNEFCGLLIKRGIGISWACETRVDTIDEETMKNMRKAGLNGFYIGVESGSQKVLDNIGKGVTTEQIRRFFGLCHKLGIKTKASFMFGTPGEEEKDRLETERLIEEIRPDNYYRGVYVGIPTSRFYDHMLKNKLYYHKDANGFIYPHGYAKLAARYLAKYPVKYIP